MKVSELFWSHLPKVLSAQVLSDVSLTDTPLPAHLISTDTRKIPAGCLFFALKGENFDAHHFLLDAQKKGALGLVIDIGWWNQQAPCEQKILQAGGLVLGVSCVRQALIDFAKAYRRQFQLSVIALTGSCGKTTVKEMVASILKEVVLQKETPEKEKLAIAASRVLYTAGNLNNDIGVPLMCAQLTAQHDYAVFELGANHQGEIALTSDIVKPDVALVNNVGEAHLEGFGSVEGVLQAKMEIYESLSSDGVAIVNADSPFYNEFKDKTQHLKTLTFSDPLQNKHSHAGDVDIKLLQVEPLSFSQFLYRAEVQTPLGRFSFSTRLMGRHNIQNSLAAIACVLPFVSDPALMIRGLENVRAVSGRLCYEKVSDSLYLVDDTYNANPLSMQAALSAFDELASSQYKEFEKVFVVGDMFELGIHSEKAHRDLGSQANRYGVTTMIAIGTFASTAILDFAKEKHAFETHEQAESVLAEKLISKAFFLIKGSRGARMEKIVQRLKA